MAIKSLTNGTDACDVSPSGYAPSASARKIWQVIFPPVCRTGEAKST